jgi:thiamine-phosphate pyrophosphorylase
MSDERLLRIVDANANRTREALRVVEDILRFWLEDGNLSRRLKRERHEISRSCDALLPQGLKGLGVRLTATDPGKGSMPASEARRRDVSELVVSNFRRAEEGLRVLEEVSKLVDVAACQRFKRARFRVYDLEQACVAAMERTRGAR